jgi:hypothetical protein
MKRYIVISLFPLSALASSPCDYQHYVTGQYTKEITKVENIDTEVFTETDSIRKCFVEMDAWVDGVKHRTEGSFSFGPDVSQTTACRQAEQRAKENLIRKVSPEILTANTKMVCKNTEQSKPVAQTQPTPQAQPLPQPQISQQPVPATPRVYGVIPGRPVYMIQSNRVQFEANPNVFHPPVYYTPNPNQSYLGR